MIDPAILAGILYTHHIPHALHHTYRIVPQMDKRGKVVVSACLVSCVCVLGAHFAFTAGVHPDLVPALLTAKFLGGMVGGGIAMISTRNKNT